VIRCIKRILARQISFFIEEMKEKHGYDAEVDRAILLDALSNSTMMT
jgi:hypothetical protein